MKQQNFPPQMMETIQERLKDFQKTEPGPYFAAFDADGTLWNTDVGEQFFQFQIDHCSLAPLKKLDPWAHYHKLKAQNPKAAYLWLAQINEGRTIQRVREWAEEAVRAKPIEILDSQKQLIHWMQENDITPIVVTASIKWAVEPAAKRLGIPFDDVCGVQTQFKDDGVITGRQKGPVTWRAGKVEGLLERTASIPPIFAAGNTSGDTQLIGCSSAVRLAVQTQIEENSLFKDESTLQGVAKEQGWLRHHFYFGS